ncbi:MAG: FAD:protein FMN transferase [Candidatus Thiodiazotropha sp. (ex Dulcina madagascariensis)]|nr:FAD:protein FMN transferase [Candidatus Thiodiazotropha sp. (ex Dulcina madagascariensis)]MCU7928031.1 FAD:protein FMN transferase [Candidatus Thiodiazotropha sp. (ex Dulcina madagascariensis)]
MRRRPLLRWAFLTATLTLAACARGPVDHQQTLLVFGTLLEIKAFTDKPDAFHRAVADLDQTFQRMHRAWHAWKGEGELVRLNRAFAAGETLQLSTELAELLRRSQHYAELSDGLFNPAIGRLVGLWGFHSDEPPGGPPPDRESIQGLVDAAPSMADIQFNGNRFSSANPSVAIDLGAFAKGYALNLAIRRLSDFGLAHAIVNAGGDLCVSGSHGDRPWRIGIRHPQGDGVIAAIDVADGECVLTSGNYERYREYDGIRYAHILDPRNGYPVEHVASATVISHDGALADAAATALSVAGPSRWREIAARMGLSQVMLVDEEGKVYLTPVMQQRIEFQQTLPEMIIGVPGSDGSM